MLNKENVSSGTDKNRTAECSVHIQSLRRVRQNWDQAGKLQVGARDIFGVQGFYAA
jgi:hypothetical protein